MAKQRLQVMRTTSDGFVIAEEDLKIRGPGELLGKRQTGAIEFRLSDLLRDAHLLSTVHSTADQILHHNPEIVTKIIIRWFANHQDYVKG